MSDFDNFDDFDAVRDFRSLASPFPGAVDAGVRRRIFELAAERGYGPGASPARRPPPSARSFRELAPRATGTAEGHGRSGRATAVVELAPTAPVRARRHHRCLVAVSVGLVVVLTAGVLVRHRGPGDRLEMSGATGAAGQLVEPGGALDVEQWRTLAAGLVDAPLGAGVFAYRKVERGLPGGFSQDGGPVQVTLVRQVQQRWAAEDRPGRIVIVTDGPEGASGDASGTLPEARETLRPEVAFDGRSYAQLRALPADADALAAQLAVGDGAPEGEWDGITAAALDCLTEPAVRPETRAALVSVLAARGLTAIGLMTDRAGRSGSGFTLDDGPFSWTVVVDRATARIHGWEVRKTGATVPDAYLLVLETDVATEPGAS